MPKKISSLSILFVSLFICNTVLAGNTPPITTYTQTPSSPDGLNGWYVTPVRFDLTATDLQSGIKEIRYRIDGGTWQAVSFADTLNLAPNPSFEIASGTTSGLEGWDATLVDSDTIYSQDTTQYLTGYDSASAKITSTTASPSLWHGINNKVYFAAATGYENMTASVYLKTENVTGSASFKIYSLADDGLGGQVVTLLGQSGTISGTNGWTRVSLNFTALPQATTGIYMDIGLLGSGTVWADGAIINSSLQDQSTSVIIGADNSNHTFEFYSIDHANNVESYSCAAPVKNCITFKLDLTPPGNWHDSGAFRGLQSSDHEVYVYTNVTDPTSGLSTLTNRFQYSVENQTGFGRFENISGCNTPWQAGTWVNLSSPPFSDGDKQAYLITPRTDFCNSNWKICKTVRFYAEDMAGNSATKDFCINGPWIRLRGEGGVKSNFNIDMLSEPEGDNTDSIIETVGNNVDFFTSTRDWKVTMSEPFTDLTYDDWWAKTTNRTQITGSLTAANGVFYYTGNYDITNAKLPNNYDDASFKQIVFIDGNLTISANILTNSTTAVLFIVKGQVNIAKSVDKIQAGIFTDSTMNTAHDLTEGQTAGTLELKGLYSADSIVFKRTLQGTNNDTNPSEDFIYEPKFLIKLKDFFGKHSVTWQSGN